MAKHVTSPLVGPRFEVDDEPGAARQRPERTVTRAPKFVKVRSGRYRPTLFVWLDAGVCPDHQLIVIARDDDVTFGILHSRFHEAWSLRLGTWLGKGNDPRYTPTTTFETFAFPEGLSPDIPAGDCVDDPRAVAIAEAARRLEAGRLRRSAYSYSALGARHVLPFCGTSSPCIGVGEPFGFGAGSHSGKLRWPGRADVVDARCGGDWPSAIAQHPGPADECTARRNAYFWSIRSFRPWNLRAAR